MRLIATLLLLAAAAACNDLPPADFAVDGIRYTLPAEKNVPKETAARPGIEVTVYDKTTWAEMAKLNCDHGAGLKVVGCTLEMIPTFCMVWLIDAALLPADVTARARRHEIAGHCNGYVHTLYQTQSGWVLEWQSKPGAGP